MGTTPNGVEMTTGADVIRMRQSALADATQLSPQTATPAEVIYQPKPAHDELDLAELSRRRRARRSLRAQLISAEYRMKERVKHPDGGESPVAGIIEAEKAQREQIEKEIEHGSRKHRRAPRWMHWIPSYVLCFDFGLLLYFFAGITNVNWVNPMSMALGFAFVLAAMVTVLSYGYLSFAGHRLRGYKNHEGTVDPADLDGITKLMLGVAGLVIGVIATLMYMRMHTEVEYALSTNAGLSATVIAGALATVSLAANFLVVAIHALDGSDQVARLDRLSAAARRPFAKAQRLQERAARNIDRDQ